MVNLDPKGKPKIVERVMAATARTMSVQALGAGEALAAPMPEVVKPGSPAIRGRYETAIKTVEDEVLPVMEAEIKKLEAAHSPISPEVSAAAAGTIGGVALGLLIKKAAASAAIEGATLGQMETPGHWMRDIAGWVGLGLLFGVTIRVPYEWAVAKGHNYFWASKFTPMIPGMMDLVRMEVREVWRPEFRAEQLEEPPSPEFKKYAAYQGFSGEHADSYWAAHWILPTITQAFEMYHRLREGRVDPALYFDRDNLLKLLRRQDVLMRYRDQLIAIAYEVPTRREIRMMMQAGVIDRAEAEQLYLDRGVDPHFAPMLADFAQARAMRDPLRGRWITSAMRHFREGYVSEAGFKEILAKREVPEDLTESSLEFAQLDQEYDYKSDLLAMNRDLFRHGRLTEAEYRSRLTAIGLSDDRIKIYLERDSLRIKVTAAETEEAEAAKPLTRTDVLRLYQTNVKPEEWARDQLEARGYSLADVDALLDLYSPDKPEVGGRSLSRAMLDRAFKDEIIDENYYLARMLDMGYSEEDAWIWYLVQIKAAAPKEEEALT